MNKIHFSINYFRENKKKSMGVNMKMDMARFDMHMCTFEKGRERGENEGQGVAV